MISFDYLIKRDGGYIFKPQIPKELNNIACIEGPNSIGKSTLLNIIAMGFYGEKNNRLNPSLKDKLKNLTSSRHRLTFSIEITNRNNSLKLISEKKDPQKQEFTVREIVGGKERKLTRETFEREYNLIYDIPDNPTQRLEQLIFDIKDAQVRYGNAVGAIKENVRNIISEIKNARDPERIKYLQSQLNSIAKDKRTCEQKINGILDELEILECYTYHRFYKEYKFSCTDLNEKIETLNSKTKITQRKTEKQNASQKNDLEYVNRTVKEMQGIFDNVTMLLNLVLPKDSKYRISIWQRIDLKMPLKELYFDEQLEESITHFKRIVNEQIDELDKGANAKTAELYESLISILESYSDLEITIPGVKKGIKEFIADIKKASKGYDSITTLKKNAEELISELDKLETHMDKLNNVIFPRLSRQKEDSTAKIRYSPEVSAAEDMEDMVAELKKCQGRFEEYETLYSGKGRPSQAKISSMGGRAINVYDGFKEEQLRNKINELEKEINAEESKQKTLDRNHIIISSELDKFKDKKPHRYQNKVGLLNKLFDKLNSLDSKLKVEYHTFMKCIVDKNMPDDISEDQKKYNECIFDLLGKKLGRFRHGDKEYKATKVDHIKGIIYTAEKEQVHLQDMGTGQSQSAYLKGLLNTSDNRKMIALFDEIAMMDNRSLKPIIDRFKELYEENKLLIGIVVQRGNDIKVSGLR